MTKDIWLNLPVKDVNKSKDFFTSIGFTLNPKFQHSDQATCLLIGEKNFVVMLFAEPLFKGFSGCEIADTTKFTEMLISIDAQSVDEVNELAHKVIKAGGKLYSEPKDTQGWMYGFGFVDLDGHRWNVLYMDMAKMP